jgi:hypothetical protein
MALAGTEVRKRHPVTAANPRILTVDLAREPIRGKPFGLRVRFEKGSIKALRGRAQNSVQANGVLGPGHGVFSPIV